MGRGVNEAAVWLKKTWSGCNWLKRYFYKH